MRIVMIVQKALFYLFLKFYLFIFDCVASLLLHGLFPSCRERGLLLVAVHGLLVAVASLVVEHGL